MRIFNIINSYANRYDGRIHKFYRPSKDVKNPQNKELDIEAKRLLSMEDTELLPDYNTHPFTPGWKEHRTIRNLQYVKDVKEGKRIPITIPEAIVAGMTIEKFNENLKEARNKTYPSGVASYMKKNPDKIPIMRKTIKNKQRKIQQQSTSSDKPKTWLQKILRR
jgi:hypothetical protein